MSFSGFTIVVVRQNVIDIFIMFFYYEKILYIKVMISGTLVKIFGIVLLIVVAVVLILGIGTLI